jgi:uncharacterized membrane protein
VIKRFYAALAIYAVLAILAGFTLGGSIRLATLVFIAGLAVKTYLHYLRERRSDSSSCENRDSRENLDE